MITNELPTNRFTAISMLWNGLLILLQRRFLNKPSFNPANAHGSIGWNG